jgi:hypothetical protein
VGWVAAVTVIVTEAECERLPLVPLTVTVYVPGATVAPTLIVRVEVPEPPPILELLSVAVGPVGEIALARATLPVNP